MSDMASRTPRSRIVLVMLQGGLIMLLLGAVLFVSAGTLHWTHGWLLLAVYAVCYAVTSSLLVTRAPELMDARRKTHPNVKRWDKPLVRAYQVLYFPTFIVSALDRRFGWSSVPFWLSLLALVAIVAFFVLITWAPLVNPHLETYVRIQDDRAHTVIDAGPYQFVRHPAYLGLVLFFLALPLSLGSWWGLVPGSLAVLILAVRTTLEDRTLQAELPGYAAYAQRIRFRWIPGVW